MKERTIRPIAMHHALKADIDALLAKHLRDMPPEHILGVMAQLTGMVLALQDQRTVTKETAMAMIIANIEAGNAGAIEQFLGKPQGVA